jgi:hypothetical protein
MRLLESRNPMTMKKKERRTDMRMTKEVIATIWKALTGSGKTQGPNANDVCQSCGARVTLPRPSIQEVAATTLGGCLLLVMLVFACWIAEPWIEREGQRILDNMVWHEPLDNWRI